MTFSKLFVVSVIGVLLTISRDPSWTRPTNMRNCVFQWLSCRPVSDFPKEKNGWAILAQKNDQWYPATDPALVGLLQDLRGLTRQDIEDPALHATVDLPIVPAEFGNGLFQQRNPNLLRQGRGGSLFISCLQHRFRLRTLKAQEMFYFSNKSFVIISRNIYFLKG